MGTPLRGYRMRSALEIFLKMSRKIEEGEKSTNMKRTA
jgi:hypothetical protein